MDVKMFLKQVGRAHYDDPISAAFASLLMTKHDEIRIIVERAEGLAQAFHNRAAKQVICHSDLHAGNILVDTHGEMVIVDWDAPILAPKERDLMFIGGGVGGIWNNNQESQWFYQGYGQTEIDPVGLTYYRYERIVADIADYSEQIFGMRGSIEDRRQGLRLIEQFLPNNVMDIAHSTYRQFIEGASG